MAVDYNTVADLIFDQLKGFGHTIAINDEDGKRTLNAKKGRYFYSTDNKFMVEINESDRVIKIKYGEGTDLQRLRKLEQTIRNGIAKKFIIGIDLKPFTGKEIEPKDFDNMGKIQESLSPTTGSIKTSYQQTDGAKLIIRHSKPVNEEIRGSRSRNIHALFIENNQGERFRYPYAHLAGARIMTRHVAEGGTPYDELGQKIIGLSEERNQLMQVSRYIKGNGLQEQAGDVQGAIQSRLGNIKSLLSTYNPTRLSEDRSEEDAADIDTLKEKLTKNVFDESITDMLPRLNSYVKQYQAQTAAAAAFESLKQQVEESASIAVSAMPDLDLISMVVYESPTVNTTELINLVLPVLEDQDLQQSLITVGQHVSEGKLDPMAVENLTRSIIGKAQVKETNEEEFFGEDIFFESALSRFSVQNILK
jgi:hypothetical protein